MKGKGSSDLGKVLRGVLKGLPAFSANPLGDWGDLVGEQMARYCQPKSLKKKVLTVVVYDPVWKHHLELYKQDLQKKINHKRPEPLVEEIVIRVGPLPEVLPVLNPNQRLLDKIASKAHRPKKMKKAPSRQLTAEEKALLKSLPDADLRAVGARLLKRTQPDTE